MSIGEEHDESQHLRTVLASIEELTYLAAEQDQREFEYVWTANRNLVESHLSKKPTDCDVWLDALQRYLLSGPAYGKYAKQISHATTEELRRLDCAYDVWHLLEQAGRRVYARGGDKTDRPWDTHERPITASSRWYVKARLTPQRSGPGGKIELFRKAAEEARQGTTNHCRNRASYMEAFARHYTAFDLLRRARDERVFEEAARLFEEARRLVETTDEEVDPARAHFEDFFRSLCALQDAEVRLDLPGARRALGKALEAGRKLPNPEGPFRTPNPWTSRRDLENEERFIEVIGELQSRDIWALESAIKALDDIIADCEVSERKEELGTRLLVLKGVKAARDKQQAELERYCDQAARSTERPLAGKRSKRLVELLRKTLSGSNAKEMLSSVIPLLPLGLVGIGDPESLTPLLYSAPSWLRELSKASGQDEARALLLWYIRLVLDYLWSVCERAATQEGRKLSPRPFFADLPYQNLPEQVESIRQLLRWTGAPAKEIEALGTRLPNLIGQAAAPETEFVGGVEVLIRETQRWLFPLAVRFQLHQGAELALERVDDPGPEYRYGAGRFDASAIMGQVGVAYVKPRMGRGMGRPEERDHRALVLYPAPAYPLFSRTCLIVEGPSDKAFFETILDRIEPGWRALRSEADPSRQTIEIRAAGGADEVPREYASARKEGAFHELDPLLEAGAGRIVAVVDADKREVLLDKHQDVSRCGHQCVLDPDLERIAAPAFKAALEIALQRRLDLGEIDELCRRFGSPGKEFTAWVHEKWGIALKRQDSGRAKGFAVLLATVFPERRGGSKWSAVWDICDRVLMLAKRRSRLKPLVIGL